MNKYHLTGKAIEDLNEIWNYTFREWSENQADKYFHQLLNTFQDLADNPHVGKKYEIMIDNIWGYKSNEHIIFYRKITETEIEIIRFLHAMMDLKRKF